MRDNLVALNEEGVQHHRGDPSADRDIVMEWVKIQREDPAGGIKVVRLVLHHVLANRQIGDQIGVLEMAQYETVPSDTIALKAYQRAEMDKRGRGGRDQQYCLKAFNENDAGGRPSDCIYFWIHSSGGALEQAGIDSIQATPDTMLQQAHSLIRDLHELAIEKDRVAAESQAAFYKAMTNFMEMRGKEEEKLRSALERQSASIEKTRETLWQHENESKRTDADVKMKMEVVGALKQAVPALLSYVSGIDMRDHDNPSSRQLYGFLKGLKQETFEKMLEPLNDLERANILVWYKHHCEFEENLEAEAKKKAAAQTAETFPVPPATDTPAPPTRAPGDGTAPVERQVTAPTGK